jgi:hypothetical protein
MDVNPLCKDYFEINSALKITVFLLNLLKHHIFEINVVEVFSHIIYTKLYVTLVN